MKKLMLGISVVVVLSLVIIAGLIMNRTDTSGNLVGGTKDAVGNGTYQISLPGVYTASPNDVENLTTAFGQMV